jgi:hypothetical protein
MSADVAPPLAANMNAAFKKVRGAIGGPADPALRDLIVDRIVELAKDGVYDIEELASRTLSSLNGAAPARRSADCRVHSSRRTIAACGAASPIASG